MVIYELGNWSIITTNLVVVLDFSAPGEGRRNFLFFYRPSCLRFFVTVTETCQDSSYENWSPKNTLDDSKLTTAGDQIEDEDPNQKRDSWVPKPSPICCW